VAQALGQRLSAAAGLLLPAPGPDLADEPGSELLLSLIEAVQHQLSADRVWLLCTAVFGVFPRSPADVASCARFLELASPAEAFFGLLDRAIDDDPLAAGNHTLQLVSDAVIVDVDHSARHQLHTGIQQVVRRTLPLWLDEHPVLPVAWHTGGGGWRPLSPSERRRATGGVVPTGALDAAPSTLVVPWRTVVVLLETPGAEVCERVAAVARCSGSSVVAVGYDCIPVVSADLVPPVEAGRFTRYLSALKHFRRIAAISHSAATEFGGFASTLALQGLSPPEVVACPLPSERLDARAGRHTGRRAPGTGVPTVLCVGSLEPRKNHLALLYAAERLWQEGLTFELTLYAGSAWGDDIQRRIAQLQRLGRPLTIRRDAPGEEVAGAYRRARVTVLVSLHEGYGLPIVESLAAGTPVIVSNFGSAVELADGGGVVAVDPRDDDALVDTMRRLLTDDGMWQRLHDEALVRPVRTWHGYASDLWSALVEPCLGAPPVSDADGSMSPPSAAPVTSGRTGP
jgi:glycosyltransferase involved in cell wall biosynthesis